MTTLQPAYELLPRSSPQEEDSEFPASKQDAPWQHPVGRPKFPLFVTVGVAGILGAFGALLLGAAFGRVDVRRYSGRVVAEDCSACTSNDLICEKWGSQALLRSRSFTGSGLSFQPFIDKLASDSPVAVGILGGSISTCTEVELDQCYHSLLGRALSTDRGNVSVSIANGAQNAMGSSLFAPCHSVFLPDPVDLIILEFSANDPSDLANRGLDDLIRVLSNGPSPTPLLLLDVQSPGVSTSWYRGASSSMRLMGQYYDIPVVSHQDATYHHRRLSSNFTNYWSTNRGVWPLGHHPTPLGHQLISDLLQSFIREQQCRRSRTVRRAGVNGLLFPETIQSALRPWADLRDEEVDDKPMENPFCLAAGHEQSPLVLSPSSTGFAPGQWKTKHYLVGTQPGDVAAINFDFSPNYRCLGVFYWRSRTLGLGHAKCWVDGQEDRSTVLDGYWEEDKNIPM